MTIDEAIEHIAEFLWDTASTSAGEGLPAWDDSGNEPLKRKYRLAARIVIQMMPAILADDTAHDRHAN